MSRDAALGGQKEPESNLSPTTRLDHAAVSVQPAVNPSRIATRMASIMISPTNEKKRVKVYELKNNDWYDRGTGFCTGRVVPNNENVRASYSSALIWLHSRGSNRWLIEGQDEPRILVQSEDEPDRLLLETRIGKDDGYQKQQGMMDYVLCAAKVLNSIGRYTYCLDRAVGCGYGA